MRTLFSLFLILASTTALACEKGPNEDHLTLDRVMMNYGRFLNPADLAALKGHGNREAVSDADIVAAVNGIAAAIDCTDVILADKTGDLYPPKYFTLPEEKKAAYLQLFLADMDNFRQGLASYKRGFLKLQAQARDARDFTEVNQERQDVEELATTAHGDLQ